MRRITEKQKEYRTLLNQTYGCDQTGKGRNNRLKPSKRLYGDYLWDRDRDIFYNGFNEWLKTGEV